MLCNCCPQLQDNTPPSPFPHPACLLGPGCAPLPVPGWAEPPTSWMLFRSPAGGRAPGAGPQSPVSWLWSGLLGWRSQGQACPSSPCGALSWVPHQPRAPCPLHVAAESGLTCRTAPNQITSYSAVRPFRLVCCMRHILSRETWSCTELMRYANTVHLQFNLRDVLLHLIFA